MPEKIYISGIGAISSIGVNVPELLASIRSSRHGIQHIVHLDTSHRGNLPVGEVKLSNEQLAERIQTEKASNFSRTTLLGIVAAREAVAHAGIDIQDGLKTGIISSTSVGGIDKTENFFKKFFADPTSGRLRNITSHDCGDSTENIAVDLGVYHYISTISTACSSSANAIMTGARLIRHKILDRVIVGGTDALTKYTLNGFNALKILDTGHCKPFDQNRNGLNLGEGAAYLVLESEKSLKQRNAEPICYLSGYGNANDAYHQTASSPEGNGAYSAMEIALKQSTFLPGDIDYVNVHGTATYVNDLSEGTAMSKLFSEGMPRFSSTKSFTGHTLAAAGSIEAVISVLSIKNNFIAPNLNFQSSIEGLNMVPVQELQENIEIRNILSNSFGFGGNCSALVISAL